MHGYAQDEVTPQHKEEDWTKRRTLGGKKILRSIPGSTVRELTEAWYMAAKIGLPFNVFVTIRPNHMDELSPAARQALLSGYRNKLGQFARDSEFEFTHLWSRESDPVTGFREHMHFLMHVPRAHLRRFKRVVRDWSEQPHEVDVRSCTYQTRVLANGKQRNMIGYLTKNSPQAAYKRSREFRLGGPTLGKRTGCSSNINARAQLRRGAEIFARRELPVRTAQIPSLPSREIAEACLTA